MTASPIVFTIVPPWRRVAASRVSRWTRTASTAGASPMRSYIAVESVRSVKRNVMSRTSSPREAETRAKRMRLKRQEHRTDRRGEHEALPELVTRDAQVARHEERADRDRHRAAAEHHPEQLRPLARIAGPIAPREPQRREDEAGDERDEAHRRERGDVGRERPGRRHRVRERRVPEEALGPERRRSR